MRKCPLLICKKGYDFRSRTYRRKREESVNQSRYSICGTRSDIYEHLIRRHLRLIVVSRSSLRALPSTYETCAARGTAASPIPRRSAIRSIGVRRSATAGGCSELQARAATPTRRHTRKSTPGASSHFAHFASLDLARPFRSFR